MTAPVREASFGGLPEERILSELEKLDERLRCVERELSAVKVWTSLLSAVVPPLLLALLLRGLP